MGAPRITGSHEGCRRAIHSYAPVWSTGCGGDVGGREISGMCLRGLPLQNGVSVLKPVGARAGSSPLWGGVGRALVPRASSLARPTPQDVNESGSH